MDSLQKIIFLVHILLKEHNQINKSQTTTICLYLSRSLNKTINLSLMQYYFLKNSSQNLSKGKLFIFSLLITFTFTPIFSWASAPIFSSSFSIRSLKSPLDTTFIIEKDIYPKVIDRQERLIEGKKYVFATINERKGMVALSGNFLSEMAAAAGVQVTDFMDWNDLKPTDAIKTGQVYYLQEKGNRAKDVATHILMPNETLWDVSQKYAMRYKYLLKYNRLDEENDVKVGRVLWIQTKRPKKIPVEVRDVTPIMATFEEEGEEETAADPELMAEWEELKKTELAGIDNKEKTNKTPTTTVKTETNNPTKTTNSEEGSFAEFEDGSENEGVIISEKTDTKKDTQATTNVVKYHTVAEAESLYDISKKYNVVMSKLKEWNDLADYTTFTGQKLIVSQPNSTNADKIYTGNLITEKKETNTETTTSLDKKVIVKQNANGDFVTFLDSSGVLLPIPQQDFTPVAPTTGDKNYHIVEKDETIWSISRKYNLSPKKLILWNGFVTGDNIDVGDKIILNSSLAVPEGSRSEVIKNTSSSSSNTTDNSGTTKGTEFKEKAFTEPAVNNGDKTETNTTNSQTTASKLTREEILKMGGNPDKAGQEGYDELGTPIVGYVPNKKEEGTKTKTEETQTKAAIYVVQSQDMLGKIAQKFGTTTKEMMVWNPKTAPNGSINIGDTLFVSKPQTTKTVTEETKKQETATVYPADYYGKNFHVVQKNENIYNLSYKYVVPTTRLIEWNKLDPNTIDLPIGTKIIINEEGLKMASGNNESASKKEENKTIDTTTQVNRSYHTVEKGETLFSVAQKYNISTAQLREWNSRQGDLVYEGEKLIIGLK
jgi:LysM repeat protein